MSKIRGKKEKSENQVDDFLRGIIDEINKEFKEQVVTTLVESAASDVTRLSFGSLGYDIATGGGAPIGRHTILYGAESSGKTTVAILNLVQYQKTGDKRYALVVDSEFAFDKKYAKNLGVDLSRVIFCQPDNSDMGYKVIRKLLDRNAIGWMLTDSIASLLPQSIIDSELDASNMGVHAKEMGKIFKSITASISKNGVTAIWINQIRDSLGGYGGGTTIPAGKAQKFYASIMVQVFRGSKVDNKDGTFSNEGWIRVEKNKVAPPFREAKYTMSHGKGICISTEVLAYGVACGVLYKKGHSHYYDDTLENDPEKSKDHVMLGKSKKEAVQLLNDNIEFRQGLYNNILEVYISDADLDTSIEELNGVEVVPISDDYEEYND